jgi:NAD/NADP transhydrogenase alpha subunit
VNQSLQLYQDADIVTRIRPPQQKEGEIQPLANKLLISMIQPAIYSDLYQSLVQQKTSVMALDCVPRLLSRGQAFDTVCVLLHFQYHQLFVWVGLASVVLLLLGL